MSSPTLREPHFVALLGLAWLLVAISLLVQHWSVTADTLYDTDDAMRLVQMRAWLAGQGWFDLHQARVQPPLGFDSHWSRLIDAGLAGLFLLFHQFADQALAERLMRVVWPLLWLFPTMAGMAAIAWRLAGRAAAIVALLLGVIGVPAYQQFVPGRIDHHNVQIALTLLVVAATLWSDRLRWTAFAAGALSGIALAVGFESLCYVAACGGAFAVRYVLDGGTATALRRYVLALTGSTLVGFLISVGRDYWMHGACDMIALNMVAAVTIGGLVLGVASLAHDERWGARLAVVSVAAAAAFVVGYCIEPRCLAGPFALVDPAIWPIWLADVREIQPLFGVLHRNPLTGVAIAAFPTAALLAALTLMRERALRRDFGFLTLCAAFLLALVVTIAAIRGYSYAIWLGMPLVATASLRLFAALKLEAPLARFVAALLLTPFALSSAAITFADAAGLNDRDDFSRPENRACFKTANYAPLAQLPAGLVVTDISYGPFLLALTPHSVMAAPYHTLSYGIVENHRALASPPEESRSVLAGAQVTYVMICSQRPPAGLAEPARSASLWGRLQAGAVPDWLERVLHTPAFSVYRVRS